MSWPLPSFFHCEQNNLSSKLHQVSDMALTFPIETPYRSKVKSTSWYLILLSPFQERNLRKCWKDYFVNLCHVLYLNTEVFLFCWEHIELMKVIQLRSYAVRVIFFFFFKLNFFATWHGMWDVSSLTRDWTHDPCIGSMELQALDHRCSVVSDSLQSYGL